MTQFLVTINFSKKHPSLESSFQSGGTFCFKTCSCPTGIRKKVTELYACYGPLMEE
jgi:hypothetical protein